MQAKKKAQAALFSLLCAGTMSASAEYYAGGMIGRFSYEDAAGELNMTGVTGRLGYQVSPWFGVEGRIGTGGSDQFAGVDFELDNFVSGFANFSWALPVDERIRLYGLAGFTRGEGSASVGSVGLSEDDSGFSYGVGVELYGTQDDAINVEWVRYLDTDEFGIDYTVDHWGLGYVHYFR